MEPARRDRLLTARWNNRLSVGLGLPALAYAGVVLTTDVLAGGTALLWLFLIGVVY